MTQGRKTVYILPNLLTTGGLFFGFYAVVSALNGHYTQGAMAIIAAGIFDGLDGRVARAVGAVSAFGKEYDSLADFLSFGIAPAILVHQWALTPFHRIGWAAAFLFTMCGALRLARFNVQRYRQNDLIFRRYFQGLPTPAAAGILAVTILFYTEIGVELGAGKDLLAWRWLPLVLVYLLGILMVSTIRFRSFKDFSWHRQRPFLLLVGTAVFLSILVSYLEMTLFAVGFSYLLSVFHSHREYRRLLADGNETEEENDEVQDFIPER